MFSVFALMISIYAQCISLTMQKVTWRNNPFFWYLFSRKGSVIVDHTVVYLYNDMVDEDKSLTGQQMYDATVGMAVVVGYLEGYLLQECDSCDIRQGIQPPPLVLECIIIIINGCYGVCIASFTYRHLDPVTAR